MCEDLWQKQASDQPVATKTRLAHKYNITHYMIQLNTVKRMSGGINPSSKSKV